MKFFLFSDAIEREKLKKEAEAAKEDETQKKTEEQTDSGVESPNPAKEVSQKEKAESPIDAKDVPPKEESKESEKKAEPTKGGSK